MSSQNTTQPLKQTLAQSQTLYISGNFVLKLAKKSWVHGAGRKSELCLFGYCVNSLQIICKMVLRLGGKNSGAELLLILFLKDTWLVFLFLRGMCQISFYKCICQFSNFRSTTQWTLQGVPLIVRSLGLRQPGFTKRKKKSDSWNCFFKLSNVLIQMEHTGLCTICLPSYS